MSYLCFRLPGVMVLQVLEMEGGRRSWILLVLLLGVRGEVGDQRIGMLEIKSSIVGQVLRHGFRWEGLALVRYAA